MWIIPALVTPLLHGFANILDNYFVTDIFKKVTTFAFFSALFNFLFLPIFILIARPSIPSIELLPFFFILGLIDVLYLIPYYKALQSEDTSIVTSLFSVGQIFVPLLAYLIVGELLSVVQYVGFVLIIVSSTLLAIDRTAKLKLNRAVFYMLLSSLLLALETVIYKYVFDNTDTSWGTAVVWPILCSFVIASTFLLFKKTRLDIKNNLGMFKKKFPLFAFEELLTFSGTAAATLAIALAPAVTLVEGVGAVQPIFVVLYAVVLGRFFPKLFKEKVDRNSVVKKVALFTIMGIGVFLTLT